MGAGAVKPATVYTFHQDPGHGWLEVPRAELQALGIAHRISGYSYQSRDGATVYLEEDCDLSTFARAKGWGAQNPTGFMSAEDWRTLTREHDHGLGCFIRSLPRYQERAADYSHGFTFAHADGCAHDD